MSEVIAGWVERSETQQRPCGEKIAEDVKRETSKQYTQKGRYDGILFPQRRCRSCSD